MSSKYCPQILDVSKHLVWCFCCSLVLHVRDAAICSVTLSGDVDRKLHFQFINTYAQSSENVQHSQCTVKPFQRLYPHSVLSAPLTLILKGTLYI